MIRHPLNHVLFNQQLANSYDSIILRCSRCGVYLGDGQMKGDDAVAAGAGHMRLQPNSQCPNEVSSGVFELGQLRDVRLSLDCLSLTYHGEGSSSLPGLAGLNPFVALEAVLGRTLVHLAGACGVTTFCLHVSGNDCEPLQGELEVVNVLLLAKRHRLQLPGAKALRGSRVLF